MVLPYANFSVLRDRLFWINLQLLLQNFYSCKLAIISNYGIFVHFILTYLDMSMTLL